MNRFLIMMLCFLVVSCSKDEEIEPVADPVPRGICIPAPIFSYTLNDEINGNVPRDSTLYNSVPTYIYYQGTMSVNGDGYYDYLVFPVTPFIPVDSTFLLVTTYCGKVIYDSRYSNQGVIQPPTNYPYWNGAYAPDSASYFEPPVTVIDGLYIYYFDIYRTGSSMMEVNGIIEVTHP